MFALVEELEGARYGIAMWPAVLLVAAMITAAALAPRFSRERSGLAVGLGASVLSMGLSLGAPLAAWIAWPEDLATGGLNVGDGRAAWVLVQLAVVLLILLGLAVIVVVGRVRDLPASGTAKPALLLVPPLLLMPAIAQNTSLMASRYAPDVWPELPAGAAGAGDVEVSAQLRGRHARGMWFPGWPDSVDGRRPGTTRATVGAFTPFARVEREVEVHVGAPLGDAQMPIRAGNRWHYACEGRTGRRVFGLRLAGAHHGRTIEVERCAEQRGLTVCDVRVTSDERRGPAVQRFRVFGVGGTTRVLTRDGSVPLVDGPHFGLMPGVCGAPVRPPTGVGPPGATACYDARVLPGVSGPALFGSDSGERSTNCMLDSSVEGPAGAAAIPTE